MNDICSLGYRRVRDESLHILLLEVKHDINIQWFKDVSDNTIQCYGLSEYLFIKILTVGRVRRERGRKSQFYRISYNI